MSIEQLRERMPGLRQREQALRAELQAIADLANDRVGFLRLAENLTAFLARLRGAADTLSITERQRIVRLVVKDVLIGDDTITIRHSIPVPQQGPPQGGNLPPSKTDGQNYLLCKGSDHFSLRRAFGRLAQLSFLHYASLQPFINHPPDNTVGDPSVEELPQLLVWDRVEGSYDTLPIIRTFSVESLSSVLVIRLWEGRLNCFGRCIARGDCISS
jgi:site-specific DNA recombinase